MFAIKLEDLQKRPFNAEERVKWENKVARRSAKAAGLVEQAKAVRTEYDAINALANYEANYRNKGKGVLNEWHDAFNGTCFDSICKIFEKDFFDEQPFTVGDYLELMEKFQVNESYADAARRIGNFWEFSFKIENRAKKSLGRNAQDFDGILTVGGHINDFERKTFESDGVGRNNQQRRPQ